MPESIFPLLVFDFGMSGASILLSVFVVETVRFILASTTTKGLLVRGQAFMHTCICIGTPMGDLGHMRNLADLGLFTSSLPTASQSILPAGIEKWAE